MTASILLLSFIFGTIVGSFLNVVIYRYNTNLSISKGRSKCFSCNRTLDHKDLIPIFSYLFFKGRCRTCNSKVSIQYPVVEIATGIMFLLITYFYFLKGGGVFIGNNIFDKSTIIFILTKLSFLKYIFYVFDLALLSILTCIFVYDFKHKIIPDKLVYLGSLLMFIKMLIIIFTFNPTGLQIASLLLSGPLVALPFALFFIVSGGRWMGLGDAKLALILGWGLGTAYGFTAAMYSFWIGAIVVLGLTLVKEIFEAFSTHNNALGIRINYIKNLLPSLKLKTEIPFGPFMIIAFYMIYFLSKNLLWWIA